MLKKLEEIADDLATLKRAIEETGGQDGFMRGQLIEHLEWTLRDLAERPGMTSSPRRGGSLDRMITPERRHIDCLLFGANQPDHRSHTHRSTRQKLKQY